MLLKDTRIPGTRLVVIKDMPTMTLVRLLGIELGRMYDDYVHDEARTSEQERIRALLRSHFEESPEDARNGETSLITEFREHRRAARLGANAQRTT